MIAGETPPRPTGVRLALLTVATATGMLLAALDASIVGTAMPTVVASLGGLEIFSWVFSAYALVSTTAMPIFGRLSDVYGRKRLYLLGLIIFVVASALCGAAQNMLQLILFRALQGVGGAAIFGLTFAIIGDLYPPEKRGNVTGVTSSMWAIAAIAGPTVGAFLVETLGWRWVFFVNLPVSLLPLISLSILMRETPRPATRPTIDVLGAAALSTAIVLILLTAQWGGNTIPWLSPQMGALLFAIVAVLAFFLRVQMRAEMPTIPLDLFKERMFVLASMANFLFGWASFAVTPFVPIYVQGVIGGGAAAAGGALLAMSLSWSAFATLGGLLLRRLGYRRMNLIGFGLILVGYGLMLRVGVGGALVEVIVPMMLVGMGCGFCSISLLLASQNSVEQARLGIATSLAQFFRQIGLAVGVAILGALQIARLEDRFGGPVGDTSRLLLGEEVAPGLRNALAGSIGDVWIAAIVLGALGLVVASRMTAWRAVGHAPQPATAAE